MSEKQYIEREAARTALLKYYGLENTTKANYRGDTLMDYEVRDMVDDVLDTLPAAPVREVVTCGECIYFKPAHIRLPDGSERPYTDEERDMFGFVPISVGINVGAQCLYDCNRGYGCDKSVFRRPDDFCSRGVRPDMMAEEGGPT